MIIDADGHTQIPQEVFDNYLDKEFYRNRPRFVTFDDGRGFYLIEGRLITKPFGWGPGTPGSIANSTPTLSVKDLDLSNVSGRLADLDLEGIDLQVIYPNVLMSINSLEHAGLGDRDRARVQHLDLRTLRTKRRTTALRCDRCSTRSQGGGGRIETRG